MTNSKAPWLTRGGAIAVLAAAVIALAACGGGGGLNEDEAAGLRAELEAAEASAAAAEAAKRVADTQAAAALAAQQTAEAEAAAAKAAQTAAETARDAAEAAQKLAEQTAADQVADAQAQVDAANKAAQDAADAKAAADAALTQARADQKAAEDARDRAQAALATAQQQLTAAQRAEEAARQAAEQAQRQAEQQQEELQRQLTEAEQAELRIRAGEFDQELDLGDGATAPADTTPGVTTTATVSWMRGGTLTFRPDGVTFTGGSAAPSVPGGWRSASFTGQAGTITTLTDERVFLYTNIQAASTRAFWKVHGLSETMTADLALLARGGSASPTGPDTDDTTDGRQYDGLTVSGSLSGASGRFTCDNCSGTVGDASDGIAQDVTFTQGVPSFVNVGDWVFTPSNPSNAYRVNHDDAYLYFGIWSSFPDDISGDEYNFRYIADGGAEFGAALANFNLLTGSATFRGGAVGMYATQGQVGGQNAKIGTFTATATLNADFGAADAAGTLSGSITDFREGGSPLTGWRVTLGGASASDAAPITLSNTDDDASGITVANIGGLSVGGSWGANFYGSNNPGVAELTDTVKYPPTRYLPVDLAGVSGWFDATSAKSGLI